MNDKIKELAVQAMHKHFPSFDNITARGQYSSSAYNRAIEEMMLMFAELIVRECIEVAKQQRDPTNLNYKPSERFAQELQLHFGLK